MIFKKHESGSFSVKFKGDDGNYWYIHGSLCHVLTSIVNETSVDVEIITLSGYNVVQSD